MTTMQDAYRISFAMQQHGADMDKGVGDELARLAQEAARMMQRLAPKSRSELVLSIAAKQTGEFEYEIRPVVPHAWYVEHGVKPGGKGLPRFFDFASGPIVAWLRTHPKGGGKPGRAPAKGSKRARVFELELRDRYEGLAWHVRHHGVKASPFVAPTAEFMEKVLPQRMELAVRRVLAARPDSGGAAA